MGIVDDHVDYVHVIYSLHLGEHTFFIEYVENLEKWRILMELYELEVER